MLDESKVERFTNVLKKEANLHNFVFVTIIIISFIALIGEIYVVSKAATHEHESIPMWLTVGLMLMAAVLLGLAGIDRYVSHQHMKELRNQDQELFEKLWNAPVIGAGEPDEMSDTVGDDEEESQSDGSQTDTLKKDQ